MHITRGDIDSKLSMKNNIDDLTNRGNVSIKVDASSTENALLANFLLVAYVSMGIAVIYVAANLILNQIQLKNTDAPSTKKASKRANNKKNKKNKKRKKREESSSGLYYESFEIWEENLSVFEAKLSQVQAIIRLAAFQDFSALKDLVEKELEASFVVNKSSVVKKGVEYLAKAHATVSTYLHGKERRHDFNLGPLKFGLGKEFYHATILVIKAMTNYAKLIVRDITNHSIAMTVVDSIEVRASRLVNEFKAESIKSAKEGGRKDQVKQAKHMESNEY